MCSTGAYTYSMAGNYNRFPRPAVVGVHGVPSAPLARRESIEDILRSDAVSEPAAADASGARSCERCKGCMERANATFAAGCFWGVEAAFRAAARASSTPSPATPAATSRTRPIVRSAATRPATPRPSRLPTIRSAVSYDQLLDVFWQIHDPTQLNRQGPDVGDQYRSAIFTHGAEQAARRNCLARSRTEQVIARPIVTQIVPAPRSGPPKSTTSGILKRTAARRATSSRVAR